MTDLFPCREASYLYNAAHCADVATAAYYDEDHAAIRHWPNRRKFSLCNQQGVVVWNDTDAVIGIAGTNDLYDLIENTDIRKTKIGVYEVHAGFSEGAATVSEALSHLDIPSFRDRRIDWWLTGHSAGAAKASILPLLIRDLNPERIYTFASPRCFRKESAGLYDYPVLRFDHPNDIVPDVPLHKTFGVLKHGGGWGHVGRPTYVWPCGRISTENGYWWRRMLRHIVKARSLRLRAIADACAADHEMERVYAKALRKWKKIPNLEQRRAA